MLCERERGRETARQKQHWQKQKAQKKVRSYLEAVAWLSWTWLWSISFFVPFARSIFHSSVPASAGGWCLCTLAVWWAKQSAAFLFVAS